MARQIASSRETFSENSPLRQYEPLDMTNPQAVIPVAVIESVDNDVLPKGQEARLKFNEDILTIRIEPGSERNAETVKDFGVNGDRRWLPVGVPIKIQRKFVENMARSQPFTVRTETGTAMEENPRNITHKTPYRAVPFSVLHDPNPNGPAWLNKISYEG